MRTLLLARHAKSSWEDDTVSDHDRPLAPRGRRAAPRMARHIARMALVPDRVLVSAAVRTRQTWSRMERAFGGRREVEYLEHLYLASPQEILLVIRELGAGAATLMVLGHNPGIHDLSVSLVENDATGRLSRMREKFPTAAIAGIRFDIDTWSEIADGMGELIEFRRPADLPAH